MNRQNSDDRPYNRTAWRRVLNGYSAAIPPYAVMKVSSAAISGGEAIYTVTRPTATTGLHVVNGPIAIPVGETGWATDLSDPGIVQYDSADGSPTLGDSYGPQASSFKAKKNGTGIFSYGGGTTQGGYDVMPAVAGTSAVAYTSAMATLSGSLSACDTASNSLRAGLVTMPSQTNRPLYFPNSSGVFVAAGFNAKIWNPLPYVFGSEDVWVRYINGEWLIERAETWSPCAYYGGVGFPSTGTTNTQYADFLENYDYGGLASVSGDTITMVCPVNDRPFLVSWRTISEVAFTATTSSSFYLRHELVETGLSVGGWGFRRHRWPANPATDLGGTSPTDAASGHSHTISTHSHALKLSAGAYYYSTSGETVCVMSPGDTIKVRSVVDGGGTIGSHICLADVTIRPLF